MKLYNQFFTNEAPRLSVIMSSFLIIFILGSINTAFGFEAKSDPVKLKLPDQITLTAGGTTTFNATIRIDSGWHINTANPQVQGLIPTRFKATNSDTFSLTSITYPSDKEFSFKFSEKDLRVYFGKSIFSMTVKSNESIIDQDQKLNLKFQYQSCSNDRCLPPKTVNRSIDVRVKSSDVQASLMGSVISLGDPLTNQVSLAEEFNTRGLLFGLLLIYILGLSLNLTPCVYPMIPITVGYFGGRQADTLSSRFIDGVLYVLGMALIYSMLGALAGVTGAVLGSALQSPIVLVTLSILMVILSGGMFGLYSFRLPSSLQESSASVGDSLGTFGMGMTLGVAAAPCMAPATAALLTYVGKLGSYWSGAGLFFVLSLGLGTPYLFLAVFSSLLSKLPGAGHWMEWIEKVLGFVILGVALYFIWPLLPAWLFPYLVVFWLVISGLTLLVFHPPKNTKLYLFRSALVLLALFFGLLWTKQNLLAKQNPNFEWKKASQVIEKNKPVDGPAMVYVSADWCVPCKEMEIKTFPNKKLQRKLAKINAIKIDLSQKPPTHVDNWMMDRDIMGVPVMLFFNRKNKEIRNHRVQGFIGAADLIKKVDELLET